MFDVFTSRLELEGRLRLETALRIGVGRALEPDSPDLPVVKDSFGRPYIPGSSFKGALRAHAESLLRAAAPDSINLRKLACNPLSETKSTAGDPFCRCIAPDELEALKKGNNSQLDESLVEKTCLACRLFGAQWLASPFMIRDFLIEDRFLYKNRYTRYEIRNGVAISRDTETASNQALYNFEVVPAGVSFKFAAHLENVEPALLGLFFLALRTFETGKKPLGGSVSRGLGGVKLDWSGHYFSLSKEGKPADRLETILEYFNQDDPEPNLKPGSDTIKKWVAQLKQEIDRTIGGR